MKKVIIAALCVVVSTAAQANTLSEQRQLQFIQEHQQAVAAYAEKNNKPMPEIEDYRYGMKIEVAKFVRQSQDPRNCSIYPRLMTFEDAGGALKTLRYSMAAQCINNK